MGNIPYREVFNIAPENHPAYQSMLYYNKLRYRLMPYIYSLAGWTWLKDYTIMRGLAMDFTTDENTFDIGDQYMFGPSLLVCPVYSFGARDRRVYLPESSGWYDAYSGKFHEGGQEILAAAPYERMPLYIRAGSIMPLGPEIEYTSQKPADPLTFIVYEGRDTHFDLYEDDGTNYDYEKGFYSVIPVSWSEGDKTLRIGARQGKYDGMIEQRTFRIIFASKDNLVGIDGQDKPAETIRYDGNEVLIHDR
jgi:alpha-D-xyloside xylohydrolase